MKINTQYELCEYVGKNQHKLSDLRPNERHCLLTVCYTLPPKGNELTKNIQKLADSTGRKWDPANKYWNALVSAEYIRVSENDNGTESYYINRTKILNVIEGVEPPKQYQRQKARGAAANKQEEKAA